MEKDVSATEAIRFDIDTSNSAWTNFHALNSITRGLGQGNRTYLASQPCPTSIVQDLHLTTLPIVTDPIFVLLKQPLRELA